MTNKFNGEIEIEINGEICTICFDWEAIGKLNTLFTPSQLDEITEGRGGNHLLDLLLIGLGKHHPDITKADIEKSLPPFIPTMEAVGRSMNWGYFGVDVAPEEEVAKAKKKPTKAPNARKKAQAKKKKA